MTSHDDFAWFSDALKEWRNPGFHRLHELESIDRLDHANEPEIPADLTAFQAQYGHVRLFCAKRPGHTRPTPALEIYSATPYWEDVGGGRHVGMIGVCRDKPVLVDSATGNVWTSGACTETDCGPSIPGSFKEWLRTAYALCARSLTEEERDEGMRAAVPFSDAELEMLVARRRIIVARHTGEQGAIYARITNPTAHHFVAVTLYFHYVDGNSVIRVLQSVAPRWQLGEQADVFVHRPNRHQSLVFREMVLAPEPQPWQRNDYKEFLFVK